MAKAPKIFKGKREERTGLKEPEGKEQPKRRELEPVNEPGEQPTEFNWGGFLVPNSEKLLMLLLVIAVTAAFYAFFVTSRGVSMDSVSSTLLDYKTLLLLVASYLWVCYAVERKLGLAMTVLPVLLPELIIVIALILKVQKFVPPT